MKSAEPHDHDRWPSAGDSRSPQAVRALENALPKLSGKKRQAAEYFLTHPEQVAFGSLRKTALVAGVSTGLVAKLLRDLGYRSYEVLKGDFQEWVTGTRDYFGAAARSAAHGPPTGKSLLDSIAERDAANISETNTPANRDRLRIAAGHVKQARKVYVLGLRAAHCIAAHLAYQLDFLRENVIPLDDAHGTLVDQICDITQQDLLIVVSYHPYTAVTVSTARHAAAQGTTVVALTDHAESPVSDLPGAVPLTFAVASPWMYNSITSGFVLAQALVAETLALLGDNALRRVNDRDRLLTRFSTFVR